MKKIITFLTLLLLVPTAFVAANYDDNIWSYEFHLEYKQDVLGVNKDAEFPYGPIPVLYVAEHDPATTDFYGVIIGVKKNELARFGFNKPTTVVTALGKSIMDIRAPFYANADRVNFYSKGGKYLFNISVIGSSFCNDDGKCNDKGGEDSDNCPNDCPKPINAPEPLPTPPPVGVTQTLPPPASEEILPTPSPSPVVGEVQMGEATTPRIPISPLTIVIFVGSILLIVLIIVLVRISKHMD